MKRLLVLAGLVGVCALTAAAASQADVTITHQINVPLTLPASVNPCNGDVVDMSGTEDLIIRMTTTNSGSVNVGLNAHLHLTGVSPNGVTYINNGVLNIETNNVSFVNGAYEQTITGPAVFISQGNTPNFTFMAIEHVTITPDGTVTSLKVDGSEECRG
jgi:hypothetical protein